MCNWESNEENYKVNNIINKLFSNEELNFPEICPFCNTRNLHLYYNRFKEYWGQI